MTLSSTRRGQSTTEFALMIPLIFAIMFGAIEYAYYLGGIHYTNYGTFVAARALQGGEKQSGIEEAAGMVMNGNVTDLESGNSKIDVQSNSVRGTLAWGPASTPGFNKILLNDMDVEMEVVLGPKECEYELYKTQPRDPNDGPLNIWSDNQMACQ